MRWISLLQRANPVRGHNQQALPWQTLRLKRPLTASDSKGGRVKAWKGAGQSRLPSCWSRSWPSKCDSNTCRSAVRPHDPAGVRQADISYAFGQIASLEQRVSSLEKAPPHPLSAEVGTAPAAFVAPPPLFMGSTKRATGGGSKEGIGPANPNPVPAGIEETASKSADNKDNEVVSQQAQVDDEHVDMGHPLIAEESTRPVGVMGKMVRATPRPAPGRREPPSRSAAPRTASNQSARVRFEPPPPPYCCPYRVPTVPEPGHDVLLSRCRAGSGGCCAEGRLQLRSEPRRISAASKLESAAASPCPPPAQQRKRQLACRPIPWARDPRSAGGGARRPPLPGRLRSARVSQRLRSACPACRLRDLGQVITPWSHSPWS